MTFSLIDWTMKEWKSAIRKDSTL